MSNKKLSEYIYDYLSNYLVTKRNLSKNTILSYRDTIKLFIKYISSEIVSLKEIDLNILTKENIERFLDYLEEMRKNSINTRNQRLACIKSFCEYISYENPLFLNQYQSICSIKIKRFKKKNIDYFTKDEINKLINSIPVASKQNKKDFVILCTLYNTAIRINELIELKVNDIIFNDIGKVIIRNGKGNKYREIPIDDEYKELLKNYITYFKLQPDDYLFLSNQKKKYTSNGIRKRIKKYTANYRFNVTPHTFRHTKASHLVENNIPLIYIRDLLGHESITTTEIYAKLNNKLKDEAIISNKIDVKTEVKHNTKDNDDLINWLENL